MEGNLRSKIFAKGSVNYVTFMSVLIRLYYIIDEELCKK